MKYTTKSLVSQVAPLRLHVLVVCSFLFLALLGQAPECSAGWLTCPPQVIPLIQEGRYRSKPACWHCGHRRLSVDWQHLCQRGQLPLMRSLLLWGLAWRQGRPGAWWPATVPWLLWLWQETSAFWPWLTYQPEWRLLGWLLWQGQRLLLFWLAADWLGDTLLAPRLQPRQAVGDLPLWGLGIGTLARTPEEALVSVVEDEKGYTATIHRPCTLWASKDDPFRRRLLIIFLSLLEILGERRGSRRTRDGRTPAVRQQELAASFGVPQPDISRWLNYWLQGDWRRLLSLHTAEILTLEVQQRIVQTFARFPWWSAAEVHQHLQQEGLAVSQSQVEQAAHESGWAILHQDLKKRYRMSADGFRLKEGFLVSQLQALVETLLSKVEAGQRLTPEEYLDLKEIKALAAPPCPPPPLKALPWMMQVEQVLFGEWHAVTDGQVRCPHCGSTQVVRKSKQPRLKWYYDEHGQLQSAEVYRYYCRNQSCQHNTFTNLPSGLVLYSRHRLEVHLLATQGYAWSYSTYRRVGTSLGVSSMTAYRWVSAFGYDLLPVAALFGVVKSSGVIGVDEKYVLVPKNDKPKSEMSNWMYVYFAVDVYTYDLLHIAIYPYKNKDSALAFLLAVRAKGYHPRVVVTDLRQDYGSVIAEVWPKAVYHECLYHAQKDLEEHLRQVYGSDYATKQPEALVLKELSGKAFFAKTKRTAQKHYEEIMALRAECVAKTPGAVAVFDFLETHWPKLVNGIESDIIPTTNNSTEEVIRRFEQHYQNFCGFDTLATARQYLGVFEKVYRFTPFSRDAQQRIRGKSPLQLAGYDVSKFPMTSICSGLSILWPVQPKQKHVPNL